jgi:hypothetical protein
LTLDDSDSAQFVRLRRIQQLLSLGLVDDQLRRQTDDQFPAPGSPVFEEMH